VRRSSYHIHIKTLHCTSACSGDDDDDDDDDDGDDGDGDDDDGDDSTGLKQKIAISIGFISHISRPTLPPVVLSPYSLYSPSYCYLDSKPCGI